MVARLVRVARDPRTIRAAAGAGAAGALGTVGGLVVAVRDRARRAAGRLGPAPPVLTVDGTRFRDLNKNGVLDPYEDSRRSVDDRVENLLSLMTVREQVGLMFHPMIGVPRSGRLSEVPSLLTRAGATELVAVHQLTHFNILQARPPEVLARWYNSLQLVAERTRLGIPVTISSDPRHSTGDNPATGIRMPGFSSWPDPLGFAAAADAGLVERFGELAAREYRAVGIRSALHPMADLATEPRWARIAGTFGDDAELASRLVAAYVRGFQGEGIGPESIASMVKHFPGGGPQQDGWDSHFSYGRNMAYPGGNSEYHLAPFVAAFEAGARQVMLHYGIPVGMTAQRVAMAFNDEIVADLLRRRLGFDGVVCADWYAVEPPKAFGLVPLMEAKAWGVEHLTVAERYARAIDAGVDQFGGQSTPAQVVRLVRERRISPARIDESARRILRVKFALGLFDDPFVDDGAAAREAGTAEMREAGLDAQRRSVVLLTNRELSGRPLLPLGSGLRIYVEGIVPHLAAPYGRVVATPADADVAIVRIGAPYRRRRGLVERFFHQGDLDLEPAERERLLALCATVPTVVDIHLERPVVVPELAGAATAMLATFGVCDEVLVEAIFGRFAPTGRLPVEMPSSMDAVRRQKPDVPYDSEDPLFPFGHGLTYTPS